MNDQLKLFAGTEAVERRARTVEARLLRLAALLHNIDHLLHRLEIGAKRHEQDGIDAKRWGAAIRRELAELPEPKSRVIEPGEFGGAGPVEHYYEVDA